MSDGWISACAGMTEGKSDHLRNEKKVPKVRHGELKKQQQGFENPTIFRPN